MSAPGMMVLGEKPLNTTFKEWNDDLGQEHLVLLGQHAGVIAMNLVPENSLVQCQQLSEGHPYSYVEQTNKRK